MLERIRLRGFKSFAELEVSLQPLTVLFGSNAAGKSNFLDALQLLSRMATESSLRDAFAPPYRGDPLQSFHFGDGGIAGLLEQERASFEMEVDIRLSDAVVASVDRLIRETRGVASEAAHHPEASRNGASHVRERLLRYRVEIEVVPRTGILRVVDEYLAALNRPGEVSQRRKPFLERVGERLHLRREGQAHPIYHERFLDHTLLSTRLYPPHYPHVVAMQQELASWLFFYFEPRERMRAPTPVREVSHIGLMGEELAGFFNALKSLHPQQYRAIERSLHLIVPSITGIHVQPDRLGRAELSAVEKSTLVPASLLSEGTLRVLGLLSLSGLRPPPAMIGFEEPENGVHPRRIQLIAEFLRNHLHDGQTQILATTHSPTLLDCLPDSALYVCSRAHGCTTIGPIPRSGLFRGENIRDGFNSDEDEPPISSRIVRGDFDD